MVHKLYAKTIKSTKDRLKEHFLTSEKKLNIENVKVKICLICQCVIGDFTQGVKNMRFTV